MEWVFVQPGTARLQPEMVQPRPCGKQKSQMFWAAFGFGVRTTLVALKGDPAAQKKGVTAKVYKAVLDEHLPPILRYGAIFMHDNAPIHTAHIIRDCLQENRIHVMDWPPYSPDLNPIENLWALLKAEIYRSYPELIGLSNTQASLDLLIRCAIATWEDQSEQMLTVLLDSMVHRVNAVLKANGWYTKY